MQKWIDPIAIALVVLLFTVLVGCPADAPPASSSTAQGPQEREEVKPSPTESEPLEESASTEPGNLAGVGDSQEALPSESDQAASPVEAGDFAASVDVEDLPAVTMSQQHSDASLFEIGQPLNEVFVAQGEGEAVPLADVLKNRPSVVVLVGNDNLYAVEALSDLIHEIKPRYEAQGLHVVALAVDEVSPAFQELLSKHSLETPIWTLREAPEPPTGYWKIPQIFVVDGSGKVVWEDIEYSRGTRRLLRDALAVVCGPIPAES